MFWFDHGTAVGALRVTSQGPQGTAGDARRTSATVSIARGDDWEQLCQLCLTRGGVGSKPDALELKGVAVRWLGRLGRGSRGSWKPLSLTPLMQVRKRPSRALAQGS